MAYLIFYYVDPPPPDSGENSVLSSLFTHLLLQCKEIHATNLVRGEAGDTTTCHGHALPLHRKGLQGEALYHAPHSSIHRLGAGGREIISTGMTLK